MFSPSVQYVVSNLTIKRVTSIKIVTKIDPVCENLVCCCKYCKQYAVPDEIIYLVRNKWENNFRWISLQMNNHLLVLSCRRLLRTDALILFLSQLFCILEFRLHI